MPLDALADDEVARLAHRVLKLKESGVASEDSVRSLASYAPSAPADGDAQSVGGGVLPTHAQTAALVLDVHDEDREGPTDKAKVQELFNLPLTEIWEAWDTAVKANLSQTMPASDYQSWLQAQAESQERAEAGWAKAGLELGSDIHPYFGHMRHLDGAANALYDIGRQGFLDGSIDWDTAVIKVALVDSGVYTVNLATHDFVNDIASLISTTAALGSKTVTAGVADSADTSFTAVTGAQSEALVIFQSSAVTGGADVATSAQRLIAYIDTATGLPVTPNGGDITVTWDNGANKIFKL
jgi:hypothetical protein